MLLSYRKQDFWKAFYSRYLQPRVPTVLRKPFKRFPFSEDLLFQSLSAYAQALKNGDRRKSCMVSIGDSKVAPRLPFKALFSQKSNSIEDLEKACAKLFPKKKFGLMVTQMQAVHPDIWNGLISFMQDGREYINFPVARAFVDLFYGNYSSGFTGVHKDTQEIMAFVIRGKKRMLAWPFDYFLTRVKGVTPADKFFNKRLSVDPSKYRKDALVLEAEAGDVIYWPSDYWHVAEPVSDKFSAMLSLGIFQPKVDYSEGRSRFLKKLLCLSSQDMTEVVNQPNADQQLRWVTGFGFELGGPYSKTSFRKKIKVIKNKSSLIFWSVSGEQILVAANGHSIALPFSKQLIKLLEKISKVKALTISNTKASDTFVFYESEWDNRCELKTRKRTSHRDPAVELVDWLLRVHAVQAQS